MWSLDGETTGTLARELDLPAVHGFSAVGSTLDVAHELARDGAPAGTLIVADEQTAGRGRHGRTWASAAHAGLWLTFVERPSDVSALDVLSLRVGLRVAESLDALATSPVQLKWPNDLYVAGRKLGGILIEVRWRGSSPEWVAVGLGLNVAAPALETGIGLREGTRRLDALRRVVPAIRRAASSAGPLTDAERSAWGERDIGAGRSALEPRAGTVQGISATGELLIVANGHVTAHRSGSLTFAAPPSC